MPPVAPGGHERLRSARDVTATLRGGRRRAHGRVALHVRATHGGAPARVAVVASRRVGNSPVRSRAKRLLRESAARIAWPSGQDVVLVARPSIVGSTMWEVHRDLDALVAGEEHVPAAAGATR